MPIIDTHCHYNLEPLYSGQADFFKIKSDDPILQKNWQTHWQKAQLLGVKQCIVVGPGLASSKKAIEIAQSTSNLYAAVGIHPERINKIKDITEALQKLTKLVTQNKVVAIGETGLDYFIFKLIIN
jgi:Tat protein secretion system quality control protein TatD with DNase activity